MTNGSDLLLVTGATGLVGSHVVERACAEGICTRALARESSDTSLFDAWDVETVYGDMTDHASLERAVRDVTLIVHCAAKVGDWGPVDDYRAVNVDGLDRLLTAAEAAGSLKRFVHISSLGVYEARDHYGTDETEEPNATGIDGYTLTKAEAEQLVQRHISEHNLPATILRPGFIYGPRDRTVLPRILESLRTKRFAYLGSGEKLMNNTYVGNLVDAVFLALRNDAATGQTYNITDVTLVSKREFVGALATLAGYDVPTRSVPLPAAKLLVRVLEAVWRMRGRKEAPMLSNARIKFLGLNLDFCVDKARRELVYHPRVPVAEGLKASVEWFRTNRGLAPGG